MKKNSVVWRFFDRIVQNGRCVTVVCKLCEVEYRFFGNTTNLRGHLSRKHPIQWEMAHNDICTNEDTLDESSSSQTRGQKIIKIYKDKDHDFEANNTDLDTNAEDEISTINLVKEYEKRASEEEWLEDPFQNMDETYKSKQRKIKLKRRVKQEYEESTPSRLPKYLLGSTVKYEKSAPERTIIVNDSPKKDEYSIFGEYIANKLRKFKTPRTRGNLQQIITTVLWQAEYGAYEQADSVKKLFFNQINSVVEKVPNENQDGLPTEGEDINVSEETVADAAQVNICYE